MSLSTKFRAQRLSFLFISIVLLSACATNKLDTSVPPLIFEKDRIAGIWQLPDLQTYVEIERCNPEIPESKLCGNLVYFEGNMEDRDWLNGDLFAVGRKLCGVPIVTGLHFTDEQENYQGFFYDPAHGSEHHINIEAIGGKRLITHIYMGASADEFVDMAISLAIGDAPGIWAGASLLTRATIGKEHLGETSSWNRVERPPQDCRTM